MSSNRRGDVDQEARRVRGGGEIFRDLGHDEVLELGVVDVGLDDDCGPLLAAISAGVRDAGHITSASIIRTNVASCQPL